MGTFSLLRTEVTPLSPNTGEPKMRSEEMIESLGRTAAEWTDEEFASRIVGLLIEDKGLVNNWQRTIELMLKVSRIREKIRNGI